MESVVSRYVVGGMTCEHCVRAVTEEVGALPGVAAVEVDLASGRLEVRSESEVPYDLLSSAVAEAGDYTVSAG